MTWFKDTNQCRPIYFQVFRFLGLTQCQLEAYYADTQNTLTGTTVFVPQCQDDGNYNSVQVLQKLSYR